MTIATTTTSSGSTAVGADSTPSVAAGSLRAGRLEFLDALRGIAALTVATQHFAERSWFSYFRFSEGVIRPGELGVLLFFLCSGFIIPASLERHHDLRRFWVGRFFRLFPLYWTAVAAALLLHALVVSPLRRFPLDRDYLAQPALSTVANLTSVQQFLRLPHAGAPALVIGASWSLAYEMAFYVIVSLLFLVGRHRSSVPMATALLVGAVVVGSWVPAYLITHPTRPGWMLAAAATMGLALAVVGRVEPRHRPAAVLLCALLVPTVLNRPDPLWFSALLFGSMFTGTVMHRWTVGDVSGRVAAWVFGGALLAVTCCLLVQVGPHREPLTGATVDWWHPELETFAGAYLIFGLALLLRHRRFPRPLVRLGTISYSLYLVHPVVLEVLPRLPGRSAGARWSNLLVGVAVSVLVSELTYRAVEQPGIRLGRRVAGRLGRKEAADERAAEAVAEHAAP
ncbi:MAG: hypothetical protein QOJ32_2977 [Frankiaceae bacterium]|nr:hypothetical protein [Frankiaceae bacterium]